MIAARVAELAHAGRSALLPRERPAAVPAPACGGVDPELFFWSEDSLEGGPLLPWERHALLVCQGCRIRAECLAAALEFPAEEQYGVMGGLTAGQRRVLLRASGCQPSRSSVTDTPRDRHQLMQAALRLHRAGQGVRSIASRLDLGERRVHRWLAAHRTAGERGGR